MGWEVVIAAVLEELARTWTALPGALQWFLSAVLLAIFVGFMTRLIYDRTIRIDRIVILSSRRKKATRSFVALYCDVIEDVDRISPERIIRLLASKKRSPRSLKQLRRRLRQPDRSNTHLLLAALRDGECVGFLKAIFPRESTVVLIAYLGVNSSGTSAKLIDRFNSIVRYAAPEAKFIAFEMTRDVERKYEAKYRLFKGYAKLREFPTYRWDDYLQPDMEFEAGAATVEEDAILGIVRLDNRHQAPSGLEISAIVRSIYLEVYLESLDDAQDRLDDYRNYLETVLDLASERATSEVPDVPEVRG